MEDAAALIPDSGAALLGYVVTDEQTFLFVLTRDSTRRAKVEVKVCPLMATAVAKYDQRGKMSFSPSSG